MTIERALGGRLGVNLVAIRALLMSGNLEGFFNPATLHNATDEDISKKTRKSESENRFYNLTKDCC